MLNQIQVSPEVVLFLINEQNEMRIGILDPRTNSVLRFLYDPKTKLHTNIVFSKKHQQILATQEQKSIINVWNTNQEKPSLKISLGQSISVMCIEQSESFMTGGTTNGNIYIWEIPSGILLRKFSAHRSPISHISIDKNMYLLSASQNQVKTWRLFDVFKPEAETKHLRSIPTKQKITDVLNLTDKIYVLTSNAVLVFVHLTGEKENTIQVKSATCFASNSQGTHLYVGSSNSIIYQHRISFSKEYRQVSLLEDRVQFNKTPKEQQLKGHTTSVCQITYLNSLKYLVSGSKNGQLFVWSNGQIKNRTTYKSQIFDLKCVLRPDFSNIKSRIKGLYKYQHTNQNDKIVELDYVEGPSQLECDNAAQYNSLVQVVNDKSKEQDKQIQRLRQRNQQLVKMLDHYTRAVIEGNL